MTIYREHIYRVHRAPIWCQRCGSKFPTEDELKSHTTAPKACELASYPPIEGITPEIEKKLRSRKKSHQLQDKAQQWKAIYQILFPNENIPEPCKLHSINYPQASYTKVQQDFEPVQEEIFRAPNLVDLNDYENFSCLVYPEIVRDALQQHDTNLSHSPDLRITELAEIFKVCHEKLLSRYRSRNADGATPTTGSNPNTDLPVQELQPVRSWSETCLETPSQAQVLQQTDLDFDFESNYNNNTLSTNTTRRASMEMGLYDLVAWENHFLCLQDASEPGSLS